jgi:hypothetical protein
MGIAGGATRIGVFKMIDTPTDLAANPEPFGLVRADGSRRPAFAAYRVAATYMAGFQSGQLEQRPEVSIVTIPRASGTTTALWTRTPSPATVQVPARTASATLVDMWGNRRAISASGGVYAVQLSGASCTHGPPCIIGGAPVLIVEGSVDAAPPPPAQPAPTTGESESESANEPKLDDAPETVFMTATPIPLPQYSVSLRPVEIKGARDVWRKRALPGYQIELVAGPPFHLYVLTIVDGVVTAARRSLESLTVDLNDLDTVQGSPSLTATMTTLYVLRNASPYTVAGLFDRVTRYYDERPTSPECDTEVTVLLNGEWAFPRRIVERWSDDCQTEEQPSWVAVVAFATLTPTPTRTEPAPSASASVTPLPTPAGTAPLTAGPTSSLTPTTPASPTSIPLPATSRSSTPLWLVFFAGAVIIVTLLIRWNGKTPSHTT